MSYKVIEKIDIPGWIAHIGKGKRLFGPQRLNGRYVFREIFSADEISLDYSSTILPPKKALLPQSENLINFDMSTDNMQALYDSTPSVLLGVHTCDLHAISILDKLLNQDYQDQHYVTRRENITIVSIECLSTCSSHSFCKDMGTLYTPEDYDLHLTDLGDCFTLDIGSKKGERLIQDYSGIRDGTEHTLNRYNRVLSDKWAHFPYRMQADVSELQSLLKVNYKSPIWNELEKTCLGCGACTLVCPTCYCFNMTDEVSLSLHAGMRSRVWDSCQLNQFSIVAGGHNFRPGRAERQRHRFFHKFRYQTLTSGMLGCVGCGRCTQECLAGIDPVEVINTLYRRRVAANHGRREVIEL